MRRVGVGWHLQVWSLPGAHGFTFSLPAQGTEGGHFWGLMCGGMRWTESSDERVEGRNLPFSSSPPGGRLTVFFPQRASPHSANGGVCGWGRVYRMHRGSIWKLGMFHSTRKHAEHRTLNTYTQQLVLSKCSCFFFWFFLSFFRHKVALGYTEHKATNRTRLDRLLQTTSFVYMLCMPHRWYNVYTK